MMGLRFLEARSKFKLIVVALRNTPPNPLANGITGTFSSGPALSLSGYLLPFHNHRHRTHVSFTAVLGMNVL